MPIHTLLFIIIILLLLHHFFPEESVPFVHYKRIKVKPTPYACNILSFESNDNITGCVTLGASLGPQICNTNKSVAGVCLLISLFHYFWDDPKMFVPKVFIGDPN